MNIRKVPSCVWAAVSMTTVKKYPLPDESVQVSVFTFAPSSFLSKLPHWMNETVIKDHTMPKPSTFLSKNFMWKKRTKFIIVFFLKLKWGWSLSRKGWTSCKETKMKPLKSLLIHPQRNRLLFQSRSQKSWIYFIFSFQKHKKKILKRAYIDWT